MVDSPVVVTVGLLGSHGLRQLIESPYRRPCCHMRKVLDVSVAQRHLRRTLSATVIRRQRNKAPRSAPAGDSGHMDDR